jgi:hypothetical protein
MSDIPPPRDPENGQFTSAEDHYNLDRFEFTPLQERDEDTAPTYESSNEDNNIRAAASELQAQRGVEVEEPIAVEWFKRGEDGHLTEEPLEKNVSITLDQAADGLSAYRAQNDVINELTQEQELIDAVDQARAAANGQAQPAADTPLAPTLEPSPQATQAVEGLDNEIVRLLERPEIRAAVESELAEAVQEKQRYSAAIDQANLYAQSSLIDHFPELGRIPDKSQWETALAVIAHNDPQRFQRGMNTISRVQQLSAEQARIANERAANLQARERQAVAQYAKAENQKYSTWAEKESINVPELGRQASQYLHQQLGISPQEMALFVESHPVLRGAAFQQILSDATRYQQVKAAKQDITRRALPPAPIRPGASPAGAVSNNASKISEVSRQLNSASGMQAIRLAAKLTSLKRQG